MPEAEFNRYVAAIIERFSPVDRERLANELLRSLPASHLPDTLERVVADLAALPPLSEVARAAYLEGGWKRLLRKRPPTYEVYTEGVRTRSRDLQKHVEQYVDVDVASRESTLSLIRHMRQAGWSEPDARRMMFRGPALGTAWFLAQRNPGAEFERCWLKAGIPASELPALKPKKPFKSLPADRKQVHEAIRKNPGLTYNGLIAHQCGVRGKYIDGRIKAAIKVLVSEGLIRIEPGPRNSHLHFSAEFSEEDFDQWKIDSAAKAAAAAEAAAEHDAYLDSLLDHDESGGFANSRAASADVEREEVESSPSSRNDCEGRAADE